MEGGEGETTVKNNRVLTISFFNWRAVKSSIIELAFEYYIR